MRHHISRFTFALLINVAGVAVAGRLSAQAGNGWKPLEDTYPVAVLQKVIIPEDRWKPFPDVTDTAGFEAVPARVRQAYIRAAEKLLHVSWPPLPATVFLEFSRNGNRSDYEKLSFQRRGWLATLVLAEAFERKGRFLDQIVNGIWAICEESFWGVPAHLFLQKAGNGLPDVQDPAVGLFAAETAQEMAWTYYLLKAELDQVSPLIAKRIRYETNKRVLIPYLKHDDWSYLGFKWRKHPGKYRRVNNWNPWVNSNVLAAALVLASTPDLRLKIIYKTMKSIDNFVIPYPADGGSDEGPEYWQRAAGSLLDYLELLGSASGGKINAFDQAVVKNMGKYIEGMYISDPYFINYGDANARYRPDPALLYRFGRKIHDPLLVHFAAFEAKRQHFGEGMLPGHFGVLNRALFALFSLEGLQSTSAKEPLIRDVWLPDIQVMAARSEAGSSAGFYIAVKGGNNGASHNHNDIGNCIVYYNGRPVLIDAGAQTYTAQTFSGRRYDLWNNQSAYHNLPDINGTMQQAGSRYAAAQVVYHQDSKKASLQMDIAKAYPEAAKARSWIRTVTLHRGKDVEIKEQYRLEKYIAPVTENFLTPLAVDISRPGTVRLQDGQNHVTYRLHYDSRKFHPALDTIRIEDGDIIKRADGKITRNGRMYGNWGGKLYRIRLVSDKEYTKDRFIIKIDQGAGDKK